MPTIIIDTGTVPEMLGFAAEEMRPTLLEQLAKVSEFVKGVMREKAPVGVGGEQGLQGSVGFEVVPETLTSEIKPSADYSDAVETGSKPHWISAKAGSPLEQWARLKGINVYALQHSIAIKGTRPHPFIIPTYDEVAAPVADMFATGVGAFVEGLSL